MRLWYSWGICITGNKIILGRGNEFYSGCTVIWFLLVSEVASSKLAEIFLSRNCGHQMANLQCRHLYKVHAKWWKTQLHTLSCGIDRGTENEEKPYIQNRLSRNKQVSCTTSISIFIIKHTLYSLCAHSQWLAWLLVKTVFRKTKCRSKIPFPPLITKYKDGLLRMQYRGDQTLKQCTRALIADSVTGVHKSLLQPRDVQTDRRLHVCTWRVLWKLPGKTPFNLKLLIFSRVYFFFPLWESSNTPFKRTNPLYL